MMRDASLHVSLFNAQLYKIVQVQCRCEKSVLTHLDDVTMTKRMSPRRMEPETSTFRALVDKGPMMPPLARAIYI